MGFKFFRSKKYQELLAQHDEYSQRLADMSKLFQAQEYKLSLLETKLEDCWVNPNRHFPIQLFRRENELYLAIVERHVHFHHEECSVRLHEIRNRRYIERKPSYLYFDITDTTSYIREVMPNENNQGHGSMLMQSVFRYLSYRGIPCLEGSLSFVDLNDHKDRLLHFYKKHGFAITENPENDMWGIKKVFERGVQDDGMMGMEQISFYPAVGTKSRLAELASKSYLGINPYLINLIEKQLSIDDRAP